VTAGLIRRAVVFRRPAENMDDGCRSGRRSKLGR